MKYVFLIVLAFFTTCISATNIFIDTLLKRNYVFFELGGNGLNYSLNYERILLSKNKNQFSMRAGFALYKDPKTEFTFPLLVNYIRSVSNNRKHNIEFGIGTTLNSDYSLHDEFIIKPLISGQIGYKYIKNNFLFRVNCTPLIEVDNGRAYLLGLFGVWGGISIGYSF